ncbi:MAG TPA: hypothetical protein DDY78_23765 [Planctomycetales bacterium]|nr:hypothetical protein [Planctomycetales bacterium]
MGFKGRKGDEKATSQTCYWN